jgi:molybdopterin-binding protein
MVDGAALATYLRDTDQAYEPHGIIDQSARNRFTGIVTSVERDTLVALVELRAGSHRLVSMMTREAADELGLEPGDLAVAVVKSTSVIVEVPRS